MNDMGYYDRRRELLKAVRRAGPTSCAALADELGWTSHEVRGKLVSMRRLCLVKYNGAFQWWSATSFNGSGEPA